MHHHSELSDEAFELQFASGVFPASLFIHEAHLRLGFIHIKKYGIEKAIEQVSQQIQQLVISIGAQEKYHHTITIAALHILYHYIRKNPEAPFQQLLASEPQLLANFKSILNNHYSEPLLASPEARHQYFPPDLTSF